MAFVRAVVIMRVLTPAHDHCARDCRRHRDTTAHLGNDLAFRHHRLTKPESCLRVRQIIGADAAVRCSPLRVDVDVDGRILIPRNNLLLLPGVGRSWRERRTFCATRILESECHAAGDGEDDAGHVRSLDCKFSTGNRLAPAKKIVAAGPSLPGRQGKSLGGEAASACPARRLMASRRNRDARALSSVGRALPLHGRCRRFEPVSAHHSPVPSHQGCTLLSQGCTAEGKFPTVRSIKPSAPWAVTKEADVTPVEVVRFV